MKQFFVNGPIIANDEKWIYDWFEMDGTCSNDVKKALEEASGEDLEIMINSPGGYVDEGSTIYSLLKAYNGKITTKVIGMAASAASVIAMAGDVVKISPTARIMIHNASCVASGDCNDMAHIANVLEECNKAIANAYMLKTNLAQEEILKLMNEETFMEATRAKNLGFVDEIMFDTSRKLTNSLDNGMLTQEVINKIRNMKNNGTLESDSLAINEKNSEPKNNIDELKKKLAYKNKCVSSFLLCEKERTM